MLRGAESLPAGCVVQRIDPSRADVGTEERDDWLADLESRLLGLGVPRARLYLARPDPELEAALARRSYRRRVERGFVRAAAETAGSSLELVPADDEPGWSWRRDLLRRAGGVPDGLPSDPDAWIEMERRRCRAGYMRPYLARRGSEIVAVACSAACGPLLRLKNVVVDPAHRRRGVATELAVRFGVLARERGFAAAGCFAIEGEPGMRIYGPAGYRAVTSQVEWVRELGAAE
jgi:GNAT superfamily N-acetyltransferase